MPILSPAIPVLRIFSIDKAREFYIDFLGFIQEWEHQFEPNFPLYLQIRRSDLILHLTEHYGDASPGANIFVPTDNIDALNAELLAKNYTYAKPHIQQQGWGKVMEVADPFGNRLRFCELGAD